MNHLTPPRPRTATPRMFQAIGRLNRTRSKLVDALRDESTLPGLRAAVLELASDIEAFLDGHAPMSEAESRRDTVPCGPPTIPPWECPALDDTAALARYLDEDEPSAPGVPVNRPSGGP